MPLWKFTIDFKLCRVCGNSCRVFHSACIFSSMCIVDSRDHENTCLRAQHCRGQGGVRVYDIPLETPGDGQRPVTPWHHTCELGKVALIDNFSSKGKWNNIWLYWKLNSWNLWKRINFRCLQIKFCCTGVRTRRISHCLQSLLLTNPLRKWEINLISFVYFPTDWDFVDFSDST